MKYGYHLVIGSFILAAVLLACSRATYVAYYDMDLTDVEKPASVPGTFESDSIGDAQEEGYEDSLAQFYWVPREQGFAVRIVNKTQSAMRIIWREATYTDTEGKRFPLVHTAMTDMDAPQPTEIIPGENYEGIVGPANKVSRRDGRIVFNPLLLPYTGSLEGQLRRRAKSNIGKRIQISLPLESGDETYAYVTTFEVKDAGIVQQLEE
jgi:hypothetical protein